MAPRRGKDGLTHSRPGSVDQESEDSFPASDPPSYSTGFAGAPAKRKSKPKTGASRTVKDAEKKVRSGRARKPAKY
jgi:hypothetical protein